MVRLAIVLGAAALVLGTGAAFAASGAYTFRMPSGNIYCAYEHYSFAPIDLRCEIRSKVRPMPPRPASCDDAAWGEGYAMRQTGRPHVLCISDTVYDPKAKVFAYGTTWTGGGFTCSSKATGLRCSNRSGHGFFLSREHSYTF
jgi:hypothetical protein